MSRRNALLLLVLLILVWGVNWSIMKAALDHITPLWLATLRMVLGAPFLFAILLVRGRVRLPVLADLPIVLSVGIVQMAFFIGVTNIALQHVPAGRSAVLAYTTPIWVTPLAAIFLKERLTALKLAGVALGVLGILVLFNPLGFDWRNREATIGNVMLMGTAFVWAFGIIHVRAHRWQATPLELMPWQMLLAIFLLGLLAFWHDGPPHADWTPGLIAAVIYNGPIATAFAYWAMVTVNRSLPAITTSLGFLGVPITGAITASLALNEPLDATLIAGLLLVVGGVAAMTLADRKSA